MSIWWRQPAAIVVGVVDVFVVLPASDAVAPLVRLQQQQHLLQLLLLAVHLLPLLSMPQGCYVSCCSCCCYYYMAMFNKCFNAIHTTYFLQQFCCHFIHFYCCFVYFAVLWHRCKCEYVCLCVCQCLSSLHCSLFSFLQLFHLFVLFSLQLCSFTLSLCFVCPSTCHSHSLSFLILFFTFLEQFTLLLI